MTTVQFVSLSNFSDWQKAKAEEVRKIIEAVVNSKVFQDAILGASFLDVRLEKPDGTMVEDLSKEQILNVILTGTEQGAAPNGIIEIKVELYYKLISSAIGWTGDDGTIHTRDRFFNSAESVEVAGHWLHEWTHTAGFRHDFDRTSRRDQSVPYIVGELLIESAAKVL